MEQDKYAMEDEDIEEYGKLVDDEFADARNFETSNLIEVANVLRTESNDLWEESNDMLTESNRLRQSAMYLRDVAHNLRAMANRLNSAAISAGE